MPNTPTTHLSSAVGGGISSLGAGEFWKGIVSDVTGMFTSRYATQRGTFEQVMPDGTVVRIKQPESVPASSPYFGANLSADAGAGIAAGTAVALGVGVLVLMMAMQRR